jgi:hypothetical protein
MHPPSCRLGRRHLLRFPTVLVGGSIISGIVACGGRMVGSTETATPTTGQGAPALEGTITAQQTRIAALEATVTPAIQPTRRATSATPTAPLIAPARPAQKATEAVVGGAFALIPQRIVIEPGTKEGYKRLVFHFFLENTSSQLTPLISPVRSYCTDSRGFRHDLKIEREVSSRTVVIPPGYRFSYRSQGDLPANTSNITVFVQLSENTPHLSFSESSVFSAVTTPFPTSDQNESKLLPINQAFEWRDYASIRLFASSLVNWEQLRPRAPLSYEHQNHPSLFVFYSLKNLWGKDITASQIQLQLMSSSGTYFHSSDEGGWPGLLARDLNASIAPGMEKERGFRFPLPGTIGDLQLLVSLRDRPEWTIYKLNKADLEVGGKVFSDATQALADFLQVAPTALKNGDQATLERHSTGEDLATFKKMMALRKTGPCGTPIYSEIDGVSMREGFFLTSDFRSRIVASVGGRLGVLGLNLPREREYQLIRENERWKVERGGADTLITSACADVIASNR